MLFVSFVVFFQKNMQNLSKPLFAQQFFIISIQPSNAIRFATKTLLSHLKTLQNALFVHQPNVSAKSIARHT